jgi:DNA-binding NarL/FixJ family response regulator
VLYTKKYPMSGKTKKRLKRILIVDDHAVVRYGLRELISKEPDLEICGEAERASDALKAVLDLKPDLVITDISLKESSGIDLIRNIKSAAPATAILVVSFHHERLYGELAMRAGASGYLMKEEAIETVLVAARRILGGGTYLGSRLTETLVNLQLNRVPSQTDSPLDRLSRREKEVLHLLGEWKTPQQIAKELHLSIKTVAYYREQLKTKLNLRSSHELAQFAVNVAAEARTPRPNTN